MNDKDIIKALECCNTKKACEGCPLCSENNCLSKANAIAFDLIKRQQAEIERVTTIAELGQMRANDYRAMRDKAKTARAEAIKEFAERLKGKGTEVFGHIIVVSESDIDNLVKEMLGKEDEK